MYICGYPCNNIVDIHLWVPFYPGCMGGRLRRESEEEGWGGRVRRKAREGGGEEEGWGGRVRRKAGEGG